MKKLSSLLAAFALAALCIVPSSQARADLTFCGTPVAVNLSSSGSTQVITGSASLRTYVCAVLLFSNGTTTAAVNEGTGTNCGSNTISVVGPVSLTAQTGFAYSATYVAVMAPGYNLCVNLGSSIAVGGSIASTQAP